MAERDDAYYERKEQEAISRARYSKYLRDWVRHTGRDEVLEVEGIAQHITAMRRLREYENRNETSDRLDEDNERVDDEIQRNKPGFFDPFLLAIPNWMLPSRDGWYGRMFD